MAAVNDGGHEVPPVINPEYGSSVKVQIDGRDYEDVMEELVESEEFGRMVVRNDGENYSMWVGSGIVIETYKESGGSPRSGIKEKGESYIRASTIEDSVDPEAIDWAPGEERTVENRTVYDVDRETYHEAVEQIIDEIMTESDNIGKGGHVGGTPTTVWRDPEVRDTVEEWFDESYRTAGYEDDRVMTDGGFSMRRRASENNPEPEEEPDTRETTAWEEFGIVP